VLLVLYTLVLVAHGLLFFFGQFSLELKCLIGYVPESAVSAATKVLIYPAKNVGSALIADLSHSQCISGSITLLGSKTSVPLASFQYQKVVFHFDAAQDSFSRMLYPCTGTVLDYLSSTGHTSERNLSLAELVWGRNEFAIPSPDFLTVFLVCLTTPHLMK
jgi:hypothetical protein